jgi:hypothetical protein
LAQILLDYGTPMGKYRSVDVAELTPGSTLAVSVFDKDYRKLLQAGARIDEHVLDHFKQRGITSVLVESRAGEVVTCGFDVLDEPAEEEDSNRQTVRRCSACRSTIELRPPTLAQPATVWACSHCGALYFGSEGEDATPAGLSRPAVANPFVLDSAANQEARKQAIPVETARRFAKIMATDEIQWADRRRHKRYVITVPAAVLPLAGDFRVSGNAMVMTTANLSLGGASLLYYHFVQNPFLAIDFSIAGVDQLQVVFQVLRCRSLGLAYEIGGQFISRLSRPPTTASLST